VSATEDGVSFAAACDYPAGFCVRVACGAKASASALCDGRPVAHVVRQELGQAWAEVALPPGEHRAEVRWPV